MVIPVMNGKGEIEYASVEITTPTGKSPPKAIRPSILWKMP